MNDLSKLRIIPLGGGPGMVTNNMFLYEYGNDALIIDCGIGFPDDKVSDDILIPDISYLKSHPKNIHGIVLSHGHDDHIAALSYILPEIRFPKVFGSRLTAAFAQDRLKDTGINQKIITIKETDQLQLGPFTVDPIHVTHSVPDTFHFVINTPVGAIYHGSDFKFDLTPVDNWPPNFQKIVSLSKKGILCLLADCLRSERTGFTPSESTLADSIHREASKCSGRLIFTTMSSQIHRIQQAVDVAVNLGRKIVFVGRSMETNTLTAANLGFLKIPRKSLVDKKRFRKIPDNQLCLIIAGSQGQESSSLTRYASGVHKLIKIKPADKIIYSADIIPGNEQAVYSVIDQLTKHNLDVVYQETADDLHASGHASAGEIQLLMELVNPHYLYPIGGSFHHMGAFKKLGLQVGFSQDQIIMPTTSQVVSFDHSGYYSFAETLKLESIRINQNQ